MKKFYYGLTAIAVIGAAATTLLATVTPSAGILKADTAFQPMAAQSSTHATAKHSRVMAKAAEDSYAYWTTAKSCYNESGSADLSNGVVRNYGTKVKIDGDKAIVYGLFDLPTGEVEEEYPLEGVYNDITNTITIKTAEYTPENEPEDYAPIADIYMPASDSYLNVVLLVGDMDEYNQIETREDLVLKISEDFTTITSRTGFGGYVFNEEGEAQGVYDFYQAGVTMSLSTPDAPLTVSLKSLDFNGLFICEGLPVKQSFIISNPSSEDVTFKIESSSDNLTTSVTEGTLEACSQKAVEATLLPTQAGVFEGTLTITSSNSAEVNKITTKVEVWEQPDYTKITKAGSEKIDFQRSPVYPFVISEFDNHIAAASTNNGYGDNTQSWFSCTVDVPAGKTGVFSWDAAQIAKQPNSLVIFVDQEAVKYNYYSQTNEPEDMSGVTALSEGTHEIAFVTVISMDWSIYDTPTTGYVWGLDYQLVDEKPNSAMLLDRTADFGSIYFDKLSVENRTSVTLLNTGTEPLKVTGVSSDGNFSGEVPGVSVPIGGEIEVPLIWTAMALGEDKGGVTISTTAGDFTVECVGVAEALPYDYSAIVTEGEISFTTDKAWPFKPSGNGKYFYNSTSKQDIPGITYSWLEATFEVPEGQVGIISWTALNESEDIFWFMDTPSVISGTIFTIDGGNEETVGGMDVDCSSNAIYKSNQLTFTPGRHTVKFNYKKTSNEDKFVFGDDRVMLSQIGLKLVNENEHKSDISTNEANFPKGIFVGCAGHFPVTVYNYTNKTPELLGSESDGPFVAKVANTIDNNLNLIIEFNPEKGEEYTGDVTIKTNIGDYTVSCIGQGRESNLGTAIFYESFEYDFENNWIIQDNNKDGNKWQKLSPYVAAFKNLKVVPYEGNDCLLIMGYNPAEFTSFETDDVAATPEITIPADGKTTLQFQFKGYSYNPQNMEVLVGEGDDLAAFTVVETVSFDSPIEWETKQIDLAAFAGKTVRIAFKAADVDNYFLIDDVLVATTGTVGIGSVVDDATVVSVEYYTIYGKRCERPANGLFIEMTHHSDGRVSTRKIMAD